MLNPQQLNPPPTEPLYVVSIRTVLLYLQEFNEVEDLGLDKDDGTGVLLINADALSWRGYSSGTPFRFEPCFDHDL